MQVALQLHVGDTLTWHEPVSMVTDVEGAITTAGLSAAGVYTAGVQYLVGGKWEEPVDADELLQPDLASPLCVRRPHSQSALQQQVCKTRFRGTHEKFWGCSAAYKSLRSNAVGLSTKLPTSTCGTDQAFTSAAQNQAEMQTHATGAHVL